MIAFFTLLKTFLCYYGIEAPQACSAEARPISDANYSIIYLLLGPFLILNVMNNRLKYQIPAIIIIIGMLILALILVTPKKTVLTYFGLLFIVGAQIMAVLVYRSRERSQRYRFIVNAKNLRLTDELRHEIQAKTAAQMKALDEENKRTQFTNILFHEMRVPLNSVILSMNDIESDDSFKKTLNPDMLENFDRIDSGLNAIITVLNDSLDLRKMNEGKLQITNEPFNYYTTLKEVMHSMESGWKSKDIDFHFEWDDNLNIPYLLLGDKNRLRQVVANYVSNAIKFTPPGGVITLKVIMETRDDEKVTIYTQVEDTGIGIRKEDQKKLFKPFVQIDAAKLQGGKGSGLGLSIVASIIQSMNGQFGIISEYGSGSIFWFRVTLKISDQQTNVQQMIEYESSKKPQPVRPLHILVTDDDTATRKIMRRLLTRMGHTVDEAEDGIECLEKFQSGEVYDVMFIDNLMPRMNGLDAIRILRSRGYTAPIVSVTGSGDEKSRQELMDVGATRVMLKPATAPMISNVLSDLSKYK